MIDIATMAVVALPSAIAGAFLAHTFLPAKCEGSPNACASVAKSFRCYRDRKAHDKLIATTNELRAKLGWEPL